MSETFSLSKHIRNTKVFDNDAAGGEHDGREQCWAVYTVVDMEANWVKSPALQFTIYINLGKSYDFPHFPLPNSYIPYSRVLRNIYDDCMMVVPVPHSLNFLWLSFLIYKQVVIISSLLLADILLYPCILGIKLTQRDNADSAVQFITPVGPRQSLLLAKGPNQFLWKPYIP